MHSKCGIVKTQPLTLAVTSEASLRQDEIPSRITGMFDTVYTWLPESGATQTGHNYAIYRHTADGMHMRVGFPVSAAFEDTESVECLLFPGSEAAHIMHQGSYDGIPGAFGILHAWCNESGLALAGLNWEVYGDWQDDPAMLTTDIYLRLS